MRRAQSLAAIFGRKWWLRALRARTKHLDAFPFSNIHIVGDSAAADITMYYHSANGLFLVGEIRVCEDFRHSEAREGFILMLRGEFRLDCLEACRVVRWHG